MPPEIIYNHHDQHGIARAIVTPSGQLTITDPALQQAIAGGSGVSVLNKYGKNPDIDTGTVPEDVIDTGGLVVFPTADRIHQIKSTSIQDIGTLISTGTITSNGGTSLLDSTATFISDGVSVGDTVLDDTDQDHSIVTVVVSETELTVEPWHHSSEDKTGDTYRIVNPSGTGSAVLHIKSAYKKSDGTAYTEFVILNGTTNVPTVNALYRINRMHGHGVGSNGSNVGTITATADTDATITAQINPNNGQTQMAVAYIPLGKIGLITNYYGSMFRSGAAKDALAELEMRSNLWGADSENLEHTIGVSVIGGVSYKIFNPYKVIGGETDVWLRINNVSDDNSIVLAGFDIILLDADTLV